MLDSMEKLFLALRYKATRCNNVTEHEEPAPSGRLTYLENTTLGLFYGVMQQLPLAKGAKRDVLGSGSDTRKGN